MRGYQLTHNAQIMDRDDDDMRENEVDPESADKDLSLDSMAEDEDDEVEGFDDVETEEL